MKRLAAVFLMATVGSIAGAGIANAASLVYFDGSDNVAAARPDGSEARELTNDKFHKDALSVDGRGRIAYFQYASGSLSSPSHSLIDQNGKHLDGPFSFGSMGLCGYVPPFRSAFSPDGTWIAATYIHGNNCDVASFTVTTRLIDSNGPTLDGSVYGSFSGMSEPRFLPQDQAQLSGIVGNEIDIWQAPNNPSLVSWIGLDDPNWDIDSFDYDPSRNRMIMEQSPSGIPEDGERRDILLLDFTAPAGALTPVCTFDGLVNKSQTPARPRYSPDGKQIAWTGPAGIYVSPAPTDNSGTCKLSPKLVVKGGSNVEWAPFDLKDAASGRISIVGVSGTTRAGFRSGSTVNVRTPAGGAVRVTATVSKSTAKSLGLSKKPPGAVLVAAGNRSATKAGTIAIRLKPTAKARSSWRKLAGVRVALKAVQGSRSATRTVKLTR